MATRSRRSSGQEHRHGVLVRMCRAGCSHHKVFKTGPSSAADPVSSIFTHFIICFLHKLLLNGTTASTSSLGTDGASV
jgi:hypothetical protein